MSSAVAADVELLDGVRLSDALRAGIYRLFAQTEHINKINVFPVADGDTGTNLSMTLSAVLATLERTPTAHAGTVLVRVADAAIDGARGNSGAILAQFLLGLGDWAGHLAQLSARDFAAAVKRGAKYAHDALTEPREGTLLTVLRDFAHELERLAGVERLGEFHLLIARGLTRARESLERTRSQLEELRAANVVDAGAQGFVELLDGMSSYFETGEVGEMRAPEHHADEALAPAAVATDQRYCTECVISGEAIEPRRLREQLSALGSSLVVAGTRRKARVHVHTNDPERVFRIASGFGAVSAQKADDMLRQQAAAHHSKSRRVAIVMDSAADVPDEALERLELHVVPVRVHFGSKSYLDKVTLSPEELYHELERNPEHPKTSQPPPGDFRRMYEFLVSHYDAVVSIALTPRVSGTYGAAVSAAERVPGGRVTVVDSANASLGQGLIAMYAAECAQAGLSAREVADASGAAARRTRTYALLGRLDYAVRGGRIPGFVRTIAEALHLVPVITNFSDGRIGAGGFLVGRRRLNARFAAYVRRRLNPEKRYRILVGHANAREEGARLLAQIAANLPNVEASPLTAVGTALGVHGGPGMLVVGVQEYVPPPRVLA